MGRGEPPSSSAIVSVLCCDSGDNHGRSDAEPTIAIHARASDAVRAALELREAADDTDDPQLRSAIDTGELDSDGDASAIAHRSRRLLRAGHPGQILASSPTVEVARRALGADFALIDLGTHHLRGVDGPMWIWQVCRTGEIASYPPLRTREAAAAMLPVTTTSFIGRESDLVALGDLIGQHRAVSVVGSGGCGKTRLAVELALDVLGRFRHGVGWVDLAPVTSPAAIVEVVAAAVGFRSTTDISLGRVVAHIGARSMLLLVDNCEHVVDDAARAISAIVAGCPNVHVLATSREPLAIAGEVVWRIPSLQVPDGSNIATDAARLLIDRIRSVRPGYQPDDADRVALAAICRRLDGIPLAVELAAARTSTMSVTELAAQLDERFSLLGGGARDAVARQRTLEASVAWSYQLLDDDEQRAFRRLSAFTGSFSSAAANRLCDHVRNPERVMDRLRNCSLIVERPGPDARLVMLEPVRWFAREKLIDRGEADLVLGRHLDWCLDVSRSLGGQLEGPGVQDALIALDADVDNLRAAMEWALGHGRGLDAARIIAATSWFWVWRGRIIETEQCLRRSGTDETKLEPHDRLDILWARCELTWIQGRGIGDLVDEGVSLARDIGDQRMVAKFLVSHSRILAFTDPHGTIERAPQEREMCRREGLPFWSATSLVSEVRANFSLGRFDRAGPLLDQLRVESRALRHPQVIADEISRRAILDRYRGRYDAVRRAVAEINEVTDGLTSVNSQALVHAETALVDVAQGHAESALAAMDELYCRYTTAGEYGYLPSIALPIIEALIDLGRPEEAIERSEQVWRGSGAISWRLRLGNARAKALLAAGNTDAAATALNGLLAEALDVGNEHEAAIAEQYLAVIDRTTQRYNEAESRLHRAIETQARLGYPQYIADNLEELAGIELEHSRPTHAAVLLGAGAAIRDASGVTRRVGRQDEYEADVALARDLLGDAFDEHWHRGSLLNADDAVEFARRGRGERRRPSTGWESLTVTERKVADLAAEGHTNPEIAAALIMGRATVKTHLSNILRKLGLTNRTQLAGLAARRDG